jgi:hypothetical protein
VTSIVIPAHNEEQVIGRLLDALTVGTPPADGPGPFGIVVVCNGCTDATARVAARPGVTVVEIPVPSKHAALRAGDEHARGFPRLYVDADVVIDAAGVRTLAEAVDASTGVLAAAPGRDLPLTGCAWRVRAYYRVWQLLPAVREGLFGRGVIALSEAGHARIADLPPLMADDLAASLAFAPHERQVAERARVTVRPPRTWADLIRRRVRADTSSHQLERYQAATRPAGTEQAASSAPSGPRASASSAPGPSAPPSARTSTADLRTLLLGRPWLLPHMAVFLAAAVTARRRSRRAVGAGDFGTWLRDESSRAG